MVAREGSFNAFLKLKLFVHSAAALKKGRTCSRQINRTYKSLLTRTNFLSLGLSCTGGGSQGVNCSDFFFLRPSAPPPPPPTEPTIPELGAIEPFLPPPVPTPPTKKLFDLYCHKRASGIEFPPAAACWNNADAVVGARNRARVWNKPAARFFMPPDWKQHSEWGPILCKNTYIGLSAMLVVILRSESSKNVQGRRCAYPSGGNNYWMFWKNSWAYFPCNNCLPRRLLIYGLSTSSHSAERRNLGQSLAHVLRRSHHRRPQTGGL